MAGLRRLLALVALVAVQGSALAQDATLRIVVGFPPGGPLDVIARILAAKVQEQTGRPAMVENRPGAGGVIAADAVAKARPDGSTVLMAPFVVTSYFPFLYRKLPFDAVNDLAPVTQIGSFQFALAANENVPAKSMAEFIAYAKAHSADLNYGSSSSGTAAHFLGEMFNRAAGTSIQHVPYKGSSESTTALLSGQIQLIFDQPAAILTHYKAGKIRVYAITGEERSPVMPEVPTFKELRLGLKAIESADTWYGIYAPARVPVAELDRLDAAFRAALRDPDVASRMAQLNIRVTATPRARFAGIVAEDRERWGVIIKETGFVLD